jgi:hypothetical protein
MFPSLPYGAFGSRFALSSQTFLRTKGFVSILHFSARSRNGKGERQSGREGVKESKVRLLVYGRTNSPFFLSSELRDPKVSHHQSGKGLYAAHHKVLAFFIPITQSAHRIGWPFWNFFTRVSSIKPLSRLLHVALHNLD